MKLRYHNRGAKIHYLFEICQVLVIKKNKFGLTGRIIVVWLYSDYVVWLFKGFAIQKQNKDGKIEQKSNRKAIVLR